MKKNCSIKYKVPQVIRKDQCMDKSTNKLLVCPPYVNFDIIQLLNLVKRLKSKDILLIFISNNVFKIDY